MIFESKKNAKRNIKAGIINKIILMAFPFVINYFINIYLGIEYLGVKSLFASILTVLNLSELGFSSAMVYHMYEPIANDNYVKINALLNLYNKVYKVIGMTITILGIFLMPLLPLLIKGGAPDNLNIYIVYIIELVNTSISYFLFGYRQSLLVAYQREDVISITGLVCQTGLKLLQILLLVFSKNYYYFILCTPFFTVLNNILIYVFTQKMFPFARCEGILNKADISSIKKLVTGTFIQKACDATRNSLDSICISAFIGLSLTAIYNNYYTIFSYVNLGLSVILSAITACVGNHLITKSKNDNFEEMEKIDFLYLGIHGFCTIMIASLIQPCMCLWMGEDMLLPLKTLILYSLYFYAGGIGKVRAVYYSAKGLWWEMRFRSIAETICNVILNIGLGYLYGLNGIIFATIISLLIVNFIWGNIILFKSYFGICYLKRYYYYQIKYFLISGIIFLIVSIVENRIRFQNIFYSLLSRAIIGAFLTIVLYLMFYWKSKIFKDAIRMIVNQSEKIS